MRALFPSLLLCAALTTPLALAEQVPPPDKALKYHEALLKRPQNTTLLDRFFSAWLDEQPMEALDAFLLERAAKHGGRDLAVLAKHQLRRGQENEALATLGKAIEALPDDHYLSLERARILLRRLDFDGARRDLQAVAAGDNPQLALEASKLIGKSWLREGRAEQAIKAWDALVEKHPGDEELLEDLVESAAAEGEIQQALSYVEKLIAAGTDPYKKALRQLRRGDLLALAGRHDEAVKAYSETLAQVGEGSWLEREILAQIDKNYRRQDRLEDLKEKLAELAEAHPRRLLIHRELAKIEVAQGQVDTAIGRFREVLKRSPGNRELHEEFVRLLTEAEKHGDALEELAKMIVQAPDNASLVLQMADLHHRKAEPKESLEALNKAHQLLGDGESQGMRIASLMLQYGLAAEGESLLNTLSQKAGATSAPAEALAAEYTRTQRKPAAIEILKGLGDAEQLDVLLRIAASISSLGENKQAHEMLSKRIGDFGHEFRFLVAISRAAMADDQHDAAIQHAVKLVRLSQQGPEITLSTDLAHRAISAADKLTEWRQTLAEQEARSAAENCLLARLAEAQADYEAVSKILDDKTDPLIVRYHSSLLSTRGELEQAIEVLATLADTTEGRKTSYFKEMSELQRSAGMSEDALKTIERWKQSAPGDKTAWLIGSDILADDGELGEAVDMLRQATSRFKSDSNLAAKLAQFHEDNADYEEANAIYWQLYNDAESPTDQARWATRLAEIAHQSGQTEELESEFRERARNNRGSIGPLLAQAELARMLHNEDKRRDLLLDAVRLQPNNVDLRLQISNLEEQSGNPDRALAILKEAADKDATGRLRSALAQAYIRQGQTLKGLRELHAMQGDHSNNPRLAEKTAASLANSGLYEEAIRFLRESLPDGGDWRSQYLLAIMLEQDGREGEAIPIFRSLLNANDKLENLTPSTGHPRYMDYLDQFSKPAQELMRLMMSAQSAYMHRDTDRSYGSFSRAGISAIGNFALPDDINTLHQMVKIHLAALNVKDFEGAAFIKHFAQTSRPGETPDFMEMLKQFPEKEGLYEIAVIYGGRSGRGNPDSRQEFQQLYDKHKQQLSTRTRLHACINLTRGAEAADPIWKELVQLGEELTKGDDHQTAQQVGFFLLGLMQERKADLDEEVRQSIAESVKRIINSEHYKDPLDGGLRIIATHIVGTRDEWIQVVNDTVRKSREEGAQTKSGWIQQIQSMNPFSSSQGTVIQLPTLEQLPVQSIPATVFHMIRPRNSEHNYFGSEMPEPKDLVTQLDAFESPVLRAWVAFCAADESALEKAFTTTPPKVEEADMMLLKGYHAIDKKDYPKAYQLLSGLRPHFTSNRTLTNWLNTSLLAVAVKLEADQRQQLDDELKALLLATRRSLGSTAYPMLAGIAAEFGMDELAKRIMPGTARPSTGALGGAVLQAGSSSRPGRSGSGNASTDKMKQFIENGKLEAAAMQALALIRQANRARYNRNYEMRQLKELVTPELKKVILKMADPGDSKSLTKLTEYADICILFDKLDQAAAILTRLNQQRPDDQGIAGKLAFLLPDDQRQKAIALISAAAADNEFVELAHITAEGFDYNDEAAPAFRFFDTVAEWLEQADPESLKEANLTWVSHHANRLFNGNCTGRLRGLDTDPGSEKDSKDYQKLVTIGRRLANAMLRHGSIAEGGFRLLGCSRVWEIKADERDRQAREVFLKARVGTTDPRFYGHRNAHYFSFRSGNSSSSSGETRDEHSSVKWITSRLKETKDADKVLPPDYLAKLKQANPTVGELIDAIANLSNVEQLEKLWASDSLENTSDPFIGMCQQAILERAGSIPDAGGFFLERIRQIKPGSIRPSHFSPDATSTFSLIGAALNVTALQDDPKDLEAVCKAVAEHFFNGDLEFTKDTNDNRRSMALHMIDNLYEQTDIGPLACIRIHSTMFRMGIPSGYHDYRIRKCFESLQFKDIKEAEKHFASYGWLEDAETWKPFAAVIIDQEHNNQGRVSFMRKQQFMQPEVMASFSHRIPGSDLIKHFAERKPATFGSLVTAASLAHGTQRNELIGRAFQLAAPKLAKMSPQRSEDFSILLPWLSPSALEQLPERFRKVVKEANQEKLERARQHAEAYLKSADDPRSRRAFDQVYGIINELMPLDMDLAVKLFLDAEKRYTAGLGRGGNYSSYTSNGVQISERDAHLARRFNNSDSPAKTNPLIALEFLAAVSRSEAATRFSFANANYRGQALICEVGEVIFSGSRANRPSMLNAERAAELKALESIPEHLRKEALLAATAYWICRQNSYSASMLKRELEALQKADHLQGPIREMVALGTGVLGWQHGQPAEREATRELLLGWSSDPQVPEITRFQFIAMSMLLAPDMLNDQALAEAFISLFESYAQGERSCVNFLGYRIQQMVANAEPTAANRPLLARINKAFWDNANSPKAGGHSQIGEGMADDLFIAAANAGDTSSARKLLGTSRQRMLGKLPLIRSLISQGHHELAKELLPPPLQYYDRRSNKRQSYDKAFAVRMEEFRSTAGLSGLQLLRLEAQFKGDGPYASGDQAPDESEVAREARLAAAYRANPPKLKLARIEVLSALIRDSHRMAMLLHDEVIALRDDMKLAQVLEDWNRNEASSKDPLRDPFIAPAKSVIFRQAAFLEFLDGDLSGLNHIAEVLAKEPGYRKRHANGNDQYFKEFVERLFISAPVWICEAVSSDRTKAFDKAYETFESFTLACDTRRELEQREMSMPLMLAEFFSCWRGDNDKVTELVAKLTRDQKPFSEFSLKHGLKQFSIIGSQHLSWKEEAFKTTRHEFLRKVFCRAQLGEYFSYLQEWLPVCARYGLHDDFIQLSANLPQDILPGAKAHILNYRAADEFKRKRLEDGLKYAQAAIESCPQQGMWPTIHFRWQLALGERLLKARQPQQAKQVLDAVSTEGLKPLQIKNLKHLGERVDAALKK